MYTRNSEQMIRYDSDAWTERTLNGDRGRDIFFVDVS